MKKILSSQQKFILQKVQDVSQQATITPNAKREVLQVVKNAELKNAILDDKIITNEIKETLNVQTEPVIRNKSSFTIPGTNLTLEQLQNIQDYSQRLKEEQEAQAAAETAAEAAEAERRAQRGNNAVSIIGNVGDMASSVFGWLVSRDDAEIAASNAAAIMAGEQARMQTEKAKTTRTIATVAVVAILLIVMVLIFKKK